MNKALPSPVTARVRNGAMSPFPASANRFQTIFRMRGARFWRILAVVFFVIFCSLFFRVDSNGAHVEALDGAKWLEGIRQHLRTMGIVMKGVVTSDPAPLPDPPPQRSTNHTRYLTIATMMKNQRRWLREWIEFNMMVGVEHFILYDNDSTDQPLEVLQYYIDAGYVTVVPWPPKTVPEPYPATTVMEQWQDSWFRDSVETCLAKTWTIHQQGPCQMAAFIDAIRRTKNGVSRWLGVWDVDEFLYPPEGSRYTTLSDTLRGEFTDYTHIRIWGNVFGTSGHVHPLTRKEGSPLQPLVTEEYTSRSELDHRGENPFNTVDAYGWEVKGKGLLGTFRFGGGDDYARKSLADPDLVSLSWVHTFAPPANVGDNWQEAFLDVDSDLVRFNHYAFLSQDEARKKSENNKNPYMDFSPEIDEFFSREKDTGIQYLLPALKARLLSVLESHPPIHPDDWSPTQITQSA